MYLAFYLWYYIFVIDSRNIIIMRFNLISGLDGDGLLIAGP